MRRYLLCILMIAVAACVATARMVRLTTDNVRTELVKPGMTFLVDTIVDLRGAWLKIGDNSTLVFEGGMLRNGDLDLNNAYFDAPGYCILDSVNCFWSRFGNSEVDARWFGAYNANDNAPMFNAALNMARGNIVCDGGISSNLNSTVSLSRNEQRLRLAGVTNASSKAGVAIDIKGSFQQLSAYLLLGPDKGETLPTTALRMRGNTLDNIYLYSVSRFGKGIDIRPAANGANDIGYVNYNKIEFSQIHASTGITIDAFTESLSGTRPIILRNYITGGRLSGGRGLWQQPRPTDKDFGSGLINVANTYYAIGFESLNNYPLNVSDSWGEQFRYMRMNESLPDTLPTISIRDSRHTLLETKAAFCPSRIYHGRNIYRVRMRHQFLPESYYVKNDSGKWVNVNTSIIHNIDEAVITGAKGYPADSSTLYTTTSLTPVSIVANKDLIPSKADPTTAYITPKQMLAYIAMVNDTIFYMSDICRLTVPHATTTIGLYLPSVEQYGTSHALRGNPNPTFNPLNVVICNESNYFDNLKIYQYFKSGFSLPPDTIPWIENRISRLTLRLTFTDEMFKSIVDFKPLYIPLSINLRGTIRKEN